MTPSCWLLEYKLIWFGSFYGINIALDMDLFELNQIFDPIFSSHMQLVCLVKVVQVELEGSSEVILKELQQLLGFLLPKDCLHHF